MPRRWSTILSAASLLFCLLFAWLWFRDRDQSRENLIELRYIHTTQSNDRYAIYLTGKSYWSTLSLDVGFQHFTSAYIANLSADQRNGFGVYYPPGFRVVVQGPNDSIYTAPPNPGFDAWHFQRNLPAGHSSQFYGLAVRPWLPMALLMAAPALWLNRFRKTRRAQRLGSCTICGYDLRASIGRCPECGTAFTKTGTGGQAARAAVSQNQSQNAIPIPPAKTATAGG